MPKAQGAETRHTSTLNLHHHSLSTLCMPATMVIHSQIRLSPAEMQRSVLAMGPVQTKGRTIIRIETLVDFSKLHNFAIANGTLCSCCSTKGTCGYGPEYCGKGNVSESLWICGSQKCPLFPVKMLTCRCYSSAHQAAQQQLCVESTVRAARSSAV